MNIYIYINGYIYNVFLCVHQFFHLFPSLLQFLVFSQPKKPTASTSAWRTWGEKVKHLEVFHGSTIHQCFMMFHWSIRSHLYHLMEIFDLQ